MFTANIHGTCTKWYLKDQLLNFQTLFDILGQQLSFAQNYTSFQKKIIIRDKLKFILSPGTVTLQTLN